MTEHTPSNRESIIIWQEQPGEVAEPALLFQSYKGCFEIRQGEDKILINYTTKKELIAAIKAIEEPE